MKRVFDIFLSLCGVILLTPVFVFTAIAIKLDSPGPVFFRQERVGRNGKRFRIFKFRTMVDGAAQHGRCFTIKGDNRVTRVGCLLRCSKIDELPQLFNVLKGEMSLVGPRPEVPQYVERFWDDFEPILNVRPGITHRATILFRNEEEMLAGSDDPDRMYIEKIMPHKLALYTETMEHESMVEDVRTIIDTIYSVARHVTVGNKAVALAAAAGSDTTIERKVKAPRAGNMAPNMRVRT